MTDYLSKIKSPADLKALTLTEQEQLCEEIRQRLVDVVSSNGGHLASNLGAVELTVAMHSIFNCPEDTFIFDVGHQCYTHKLLTGRNDQFDSLRKEGGISGFPKPSESEYDSFIEGHASTSISQAVGLANAKLLSGDNSKTIAVIGDGAFSGGLAYEAINNLTNELRNLIIVLNDNSMSISKSVGALSKYLMKLRTSKRYLDFKKLVTKALKALPFIGRPAIRVLVSAKSQLRRKIFGGTFFEELGFNYVGPVDGHNLYELLSIFESVKNANEGPIFVHVITQKGKGYALAEDNPGAYHGVGKFDSEVGNPDISLADSFSNVFGRKLAELAEKDKKICAVTAAMKYGTGLQYFYRSNKKRFFDVGIAEQHAVTMCAGLAKGGMKPVFCVYSSFLQRSLDQLIHDINIDNVDILLGIDRAGLVGDDGETHQGIYDTAFLSSIPGFTVAAPSNYDELCSRLESMLSIHGPKAIRYPRGSQDERLKDYVASSADFDYIKSCETQGDILLVTYGRELAEVLDAKALLAADGINADVLKLNVIAPINCEAVSLASNYCRVMFLEEGIKLGGIGEHMLSACANSTSADFKFEIVAITDASTLQQASVPSQIKKNGLDAQSVYSKAKELLL